MFLSVNDVVIPLDKVFFLFLHVAPFHLVLLAVKLPTITHHACLHHLYLTVHGNKMQVIKLKGHSCSFTCKRHTVGLQGNVLLNQVFIVQVAHF